MSNKEKTELLKQGIIPEGMDTESGARAVAYWQRKEAGRIQAENNTRWGRLANRGEVCDDMPNDYRIRAKEVNELPTEKRRKDKPSEQNGSSLLSEDRFHARSFGCVSL